MVEIMNPLLFIHNNSHGLFEQYSREEQNTILQESLNDFEEYFDTVKDEMINIYIKTLTGKAFGFKLPAKTTVNELLQKIKHKEAIPPDQVRLVYSGVQIPHEDRPISWYFHKTGNEFVIHLILRLRGGMLHPSSGRQGYDDISSDEEEKKEEDSTLSIEFLRELSKNLSKLN